MKKKSIYIVFMIIFTTIYSSCLLKQSEAEAKYQSLTIDFGNRKSGDTIPITFSLRNIGEKELIIDTVSPGCECTIAKYSKKPIKFNETGEIKVQYIPLLEQKGKIYKEIIVKSNSIKKMQLLTITGNILEK